MVYWDRITLKTRAKAILRGSYWMTFLALIIAGVLGSLPFTLGSGGGRVSVVFWGPVSEWLSPALGVIAPVFSAFYLCYVIFIGHLFKIGKFRYLFARRCGSADLGDIFFPFRDGHYLGAVKIMFFRMLYLFLWSLLFLLPGIVKFYSYRMVPYILAENPWISKKRAFEISRTAARGEKWRMFILDLSFLGWFLLSAATCFAGVLFLAPYYQATRAELYGALRYKAVVSGSCTPEEIGKELFPL